MKQRNFKTFKPKKTANLMLVRLKVNLNCKKFFVQAKKELLIVDTTEPARNNQANLEIIKNFIKLFGACRILKGARSRLKIVEIPQASFSEVKEIIDKKFKK